MSTTTTRSMATTALRLITTPSMITTSTTTTPPRHVLCPPKCRRRPPPLITITPTIHQTRGRATDAIISRLSIRPLLPPAYPAVITTVGPISCKWISPAILPRPQLALLLLSLSAATTTLPSRDLSLPRFPPLRPLTLMMPLSATAIRPQYP